MKTRGFFFGLNNRQYAHLAVACSVINCEEFTSAEGKTDLAVLPFSRVNGDRLKRLRNQVVPLRPNNPRFSELSHFECLANLFG